MSRSREEAEKAGIQVDDIKHNMKRRLPCHNYSDKGTYMLTLVVEGRQPLFGTLQGDGLAPLGSESEPRVVLSPLGKAIRDIEIKKISAFYPMVEVWKLCIMPDHVHIVVRVKGKMPEGKDLGQVVRGFKTGCTRAWWGLSPFGEAKGTGTRPLLFEKGYCDKILLRPGQLENWKRYLDDNPRRLAIKRQHPDYFIVRHQLNIGEWSCQAVGNRFLLNIPDKAAVIVHSGYSDADFEMYKAKWLALAEEGGVLISAAIATREKEVMREAMDRGYRLIYLRENGFPELYKPAGESFTACSEGRLLQISPWDYHMQRKTISREQCLKLNRLAEEIANTPYFSF